jgi:eukaryotic-like serine/threonine-protein kinase
VLEPPSAGDPQQVGPYRIEGRLGSGGMGQVFLGRSADGQLAAVKVIHDWLADSPGFRARFGRELAVARKVGGPFTAAVIDADLDGPQPWLATAYIPGPSLADAVATDGPLPTDSVLALAAGLTEGLGAIHAAGVVHRDLKPSNVLLAEDGPRVIDFGISRAAEASTLTSTGQVIGSAGFMSPEQAEGHQVGLASDVFSLGAVLVFAATGEGPFGSGSTAGLIYRVIHGEPRIGHLHPQIRSLAGRCLAKDPQDRPGTGQLLAELAAVRSSDAALAANPQALGGLQTTQTRVPSTAAPDSTGPRRWAADADRAPGEPRRSSACHRAANRPSVSLVTPTPNSRKSCHSVRDCRRWPGHLAGSELPSARTSATAHSRHEFPTGSRTGTDGGNADAARTATARPAISGQQDGRS